MSTPPALHRLLIVGGGSIGERHLRCFLSTGRCTAAVCDPRETRRDELKERYPLAGAFSSLDEALAEPWDAAVVATPAPLHVPQALQLLERGVSVLIEKPLSTTLEGTDRLQPAADASGAVVGVAYVYRSHPAAAALKAQLQAGAIGALKLVTVTAGQHFPTFRPDYREIYYARRESGGGVIQDALTHLVDLVQYLAGPYDRLYADYSRQVLEGVEVEDTANVVGRLAGGEVMVSFTCNQFQAPNETRIDLHGTRGSLRFEVPRHAWALQRYGETDWTWSPALITERDELFVRQAGYFLDAVEGSSSVRCTVAEAEHTLRANLAALQSGETGAPVRLRVDREGS
jgi:predicted dehydrogenase